MTEFCSRALAALAAALLVSVAAVAPAGAQDVIRIGLAEQDITSLDPHMSTRTGDKHVFSLLFSGLVRFKPGSMDLSQLEADLATDWKASADGKVWTFNLRKGVKFHLGYGEFTAEDVVYSLARAADPKRSAVSSDYASFDKVEAVDKYTVRITLKTPVPSLLALVANYHGGNIVSKKAAEALGDGFKQKAVGTGPFAFQEHKPKQFITLAANKEYFRGVPKLSSVEFRFVPSISSRELAFQNGELELFYGTREDIWVRRMLLNKDATVDVYDPGEMRTLHLNTSIKPLDDLRVRQAIAHAINRDDFIGLAGKIVARKNYSVVPNGYLGQTDDVPRFEYDVNKAKALLAQAGYPNGFKLNVIITKLDPLLKPMQVIQEQMRKVGITLDLAVVEHSAFHAQIRKNLSALVLYGAARFPVADVYLSQFYHSRSIVGTPTAVANFSHCSMADAEIDAARQEVNAAKQLELWASAQRKLVENVCGIPLFEQLQVFARRKSIDYGYVLKGAASLGPPITELTAVR
ncbi:MAG: polyamine ABC transporter substrate-binding protein [Burkholderiaceae bacterium]|nr:polyamine ABC transporter substrate-binding protein [Burkholderiaceae bacterium]